MLFFCFLFKKKKNFQIFFLLLFSEAVKKTEETQIDWEYK